MDLNQVYPFMWKDRPESPSIGYMIQRKILHIKRLNLPTDIQDHIILQLKQEILTKRFRNIYFPQVMRELRRTVRRLPHSQSCPVLYLVQFFSTQHAEQVASQPMAC